MTNSGCNQFLINIRDAGIPYVLVRENVGPQERIDTDQEYHVRTIELYKRMIQEIEGATIIWERFKEDYP